VECVTSALRGRPHLASGLLAQGDICRRLVQLLLGKHTLTSFLDGPSESTVLYRVGEYHADRYVSDSADAQEVDLALGQVHTQADQHDQFLWPSESVCLNRSAGAWPGFWTELDERAIDNRWNDLKHKRERSTLTEARWRSSYTSRRAKQRVAQETTQVLGSPSLKSAIELLKAQLGSWAGQPLSELDARCA
jgi:hypothetical protein